MPDQDFLMYHRARTRCFGGVPRFTRFPMSKPSTVSPPQLMFPSATKPKYERPVADITLFKSVGSALVDVALGNAVLDVAEAEGTGACVEM